MMQQCLIVDQGTLSNIIKYNSLVGVYKELLELDLTFFFKKHPGYANLKDNKNHYNLFNNCIELASYVPVELFFNMIGDNGFVIGVCSTSLITSTNMGVMSVSLLDMVEWYSEKYKKGWRTTLTTAPKKGRVFFPDSFKCLKEFLIMKQKG